MAPPNKKDSEDILDALKKATKELEKQNELTENQKIAYEAMLTQVRAIKNESYQTVGQIEEESKARRALLDLVEQQATSLKQVTDLGDQISAVHIREHEKKIVAHKKELKILRDKLILNEVLSASEEKEARRLSDEIAKETKLLELAYERLDVEEEIRGTVKSIGGFLGLAAKFEESRLGKMHQQAKVLREGIGPAQEKFVAQIKETFTVSNFLSSVFDKILESTIYMAKMFDQMSADFNKATGEGGAYNKVIMDAAVGAAHLGVGLAEAGAAATALHKNYAEFTTFTEASTESLIEHIAVLENIGIAAATSTDGLNFLTKGLGMTKDEAVEMQKDLAKWDIGISPGQIAEDFQKAQPIMVQYGKVVGKQVFKELERQAKATGIAFDSLLSLTKQMDTFEGAAVMAGKLNAVLGGNLINSTELLLATEAERVEMLKNVIRESGRAWATMGKYEHQMMANIVTQGDLTKAAELFTIKTREQIEQTRSMEEMTAKAVSTQKKWNLLMQQFAAFVEPIVSVLSSVVGAILKFIDSYPDIANVIKGVIGLFALWKIGALLLAGAMALLGKTSLAAAAETSASSTIFGGSMVKMGAAIGTAGKFAEQGAVGMLAFGFAVLMVGAGIFLAAAGVAKLVLAFADLQGDQIWGAVAALVVFGATLAGLFLIMISPWALAAQLALGVIALAFTAIALSVNVAAVGIAKMIKAFSDMPTGRLIKIKTSFGDFASMMTQIPDDAAINLTTSITDVSKAIKEIDEDSALLFGNTIGAFTKHLSELDAPQTTAFKQATDDYKSILTHIHELPDDVTRDAIKLASELNQAASARSVSTVQLTSAPQSSGGGGNQQPIVIQLKMGEKVFDEKIINVVGGCINQGGFSKGIVT